MRVLPNPPVLEKVIYPILRNIFVGKPDRETVQKWHKG